MITIKAETQQKKLVEVGTDKIVQRLSAYGVLIRDDKVLVVKTHSDNWEIPGGTPERGETLEQGLKRELKEEVGVDAIIGRMFYMRESFYHSPSGKTYHSLQFYFLITVGSSPIAAETKECAFMPIKDLTAQNANMSAYLALQHLSGEILQYDLWDLQAGQAQ
jgi:ADP-ribose pyrophosphatase YjhB (NUDIX family)